MNINLYKKYYVRTDPRNYILYKLMTTKKDGEESEYEDVIGYYGSLESALRAICDREIKACKCTAIGGLVKEVKKLSEAMRAIGKEIGIEKVMADIWGLYESGDIKDDEEEKPTKKRGRPKKK